MQANTGFASGGLMCKLGVLYPETYQSTKSKIVVNIFILLQKPTTYKSGKYIGYFYTNVDIKLRTIKNIKQLKKPTTMIEDLFAFYKNNLTFEGAVTRKNGFLKNSLVYFSLVVFVALGVSFAITHNFVYWILAILFSIIAIFVGKLINASLIKKEYPDLWLSQTSWSTSGFNTKFLKLLQEHLNDKDDSKLDRIQDLIKERANRERIPSFIFFSTFFGLFIPLWSSYVNTIMDSMKEDGQKQGCLYF